MLVQQVAEYMRRESAKVVVGQDEAWMQLVVALSETIFIGLKMICMALKKVNGHGFFFTTGHVTNINRLEDFSGCHSI